MGKKDFEETQAKIYFVVSATVSVIFAIVFNEISIKISKPIISFMFFFISMIFLMMPLIGTFALLNFQFNQKKVVM